MNLQTMPSVGILILLLLTLVGRVCVPWAARPRGPQIGRVRLSLLGRLRMHGLPALVVLALAVGGRAVGLAPTALPIAVAVVGVALIALPTTYTLTGEGIMVGRTPFRRWTEFGGVTRRRGGVRLQGVAGARGMTVWLSGSRDDDELVLLLRQLVRGAYKGQTGTDVAGAPAGEAATGLAAASLEAARAVGS